MSGAAGGGLARLRATLREVRELGVAGTSFRLAHEVAHRSGYVALRSRRPAPAPDDVTEATRAWLAGAVFAHPEPVRAAMTERISETARAELHARADDAAQGRILCFGRWVGDFGQPVDWFRNPQTGARWNPRAHWSRAMRDAGRAGEVKLTWEVARFPQAFHLARSAALDPARANVRATALCAQVDGFLAANPFPYGLHWSSGQEAVIRLMAWYFALGTLARLGADVLPTAQRVSVHARTVGRHLERELPYARRAVYNNHLVAEAFGLYAVAQLLPTLPEARGWEVLGREILTEQATAQIYPDGAYINQSHNYHRVVLGDYLLAWRMERAAGRRPPAAWESAMERSLRFLTAQQNPADGRLPNFGGNDGSQPRVLSTCDFSDFRPALQAVSLAVRGARLYPPGPWDEEAAWLLGPAALDAPEAREAPASVSFATTGYHVLRGDDPGTFTVLRCGDVRDRFSQIDMLHLDVTWRGANVLVDAGSYLYNGPAAWHEHFFRTASHNTVVVDGRDQMLHHRRFKLLYPTPAALEAFGDDGREAYCGGSHRGYARHAGGCVHRRSVRFYKDELIVVADTVTGVGAHSLRVHWLGGPYPWRYQARDGRMVLETPTGAFGVTVLGEGGAPLAGDVVAGREDPPRGWLARYFGERVPAPSLAVEVRAALPTTVVTLLGPVEPRVTCTSSGWEVRLGDRRVDFSIERGAIVPRGL